MVDVSVEQSMGKMLSDPANLTDAYRQRGDFDGIVRDVSDGALWRDHPMGKAALLGGFVAWMFLLYIDEAELCCPIGPFRGNHKYMFGYWVLLNLSQQRRWKLGNIQLAFICHASLFSHYGACAVISGPHLPLCTLSAPLLTLCCPFLSRVSSLFCVRWQKPRWDLER